MKKNTSFIIEFIIFLMILCFFLIPPFFSPKISEQTSPFLKWNFPFRQLIYAVFAGILYYAFKEEKSQSHFFKFPFIFTFSALFFIQLIFKFISVSKGTAQQSIFENVIMPSGFLQWIFCALNFMFSAFFEEVLYRFYLPNQLNRFATFLPKQKQISVIFEILTCLIFAFSHFYMGILSVLNALFAHIILRICYSVSKNIFCGTLAHFCYNIISLILL